MEKKDTLTKVLAITGTALAWFPILAPILLTVILFIVKRIFRFDYLMPAELFPFAMAGSGLLLWATLRAHSRTRLVVWGLGLAILMLFGGQGIAILTGLASGEMEPAGWIWGLVIASLAIYSLGIILVGTGGALLLRDLFKRPIAL